MGSAASVSSGRAMLMDNLLNKPGDLSDINNLEEAEAELKKLRSMARNFKQEYLEADSYADAKKKKRKNVGGFQQNGNGNGNNSSSLDALTYEAIVVPKSDPVRDMLLEVTSSHVLFKSYYVEEREAIVDAFNMLTMKSGDEIIKKGEQGSLFYVVESGNCQAKIRDEGDNLIMLGDTIGFGKSFGEIALMYDIPRTVDIVCGGDGILWTIDRTVYKDIIMHYKFMRTKQYIALLDSIVINGKRLGDNLTHQELESLVFALEREVYEKDDVVVRQGTHGDHFYLIESGAVGVWIYPEVEGQGGEESSAEKVSLLQSGNFFGEKALLSTDLRSASIIAETKLTCLTLSREDFVALVGTIEDQLDNNEKIAIDAKVQADTQIEIGAGSPKSSAPPPMELAGVTLDDFELGTIVGSGTFGVVRIAKYKKEREGGQVFALKCIPKSLVCLARVQKQTKTELNVQANMNSPFISKVHGAFQNNTHIFYALEYLPGGELYKYMNNMVHLKINTAKFYAACVLLALKEMHKHKIAYRDVKPENLVMDSKGYVKVVDFGMAKPILEGKTWTICGTPEYLAPEVILHEGHNHAVDYWGFGVLMYEMLTGKTPFAGKDDIEIYENILGQAVVMKQSFNKDIKNFFSRLLTNQSKRLGNTKSGIRAIMTHKLLNSVDYHKLERGELPAPHIPIVETPDDSRNFDGFEEPEQVAKSDWEADFELYKINAPN